MNSKETNLVHAASLDEYSAELEKIARNNLRTARNRGEWAVISLATFWEGDETPVIMDWGFNSKRAAEMRLESYLVNFTDMDSRLNRSSPVPWDRGSYVEPYHFNRMAEAEVERTRQMTVLREHGVEDPDAVLEAIFPKQFAELDADSIPF